MYDPENENLPDDLDYEPVPLECPLCRSDELFYRGEGYDDLEYLGASYECEECGHTFTESDLEGW